MTGKVYALTVLGLLYLLCLQSGFVFIYPLAQYAGWPSVNLLNQGIGAFFIGTGLERAFVLSLLGGLGFAVLLTVIVPPKWDMMERLVRKICRRGAVED
jgi:hypothetical protein